MEQRRTPPFCDPSGPSDPAEAMARPCDREGCEGIGSYPAPRARDDLRNYYWFCLEHVREYNRAWNYFAGMSAEEVETHVREDVVGWRPTWPMGVNGQFDPRAAHGFRDPFGFFAEGPETGRRRFRKDGGQPPESEGRKAPEHRAFALFGLQPPVSLARLKARYKELVKRHHPDANGGDKVAEEKLKLINVAYAFLKRWCS
jgi:hypothetical protein